MYKIFLKEDKMGENEKMQLKPIELYIEEIYALAKIKKIELIPTPKEIEKNSFYNPKKKPVKK